MLKGQDYEKLGKNIEKKGQWRKKENQETVASEKVSEKEVSNPW